MGKSAIAAGRLPDAPGLGGRSDALHLPGCVQCVGLPCRCSTQGDLGLWRCRINLDVLAILLAAALCQTGYGAQAGGSSETSVSNRIQGGLSAIPSLCIKTDRGSLFGQKGIYDHPTERGESWERPASVELSYPGGNGGFRINCGLRIHGGLSRNPEESPKHSFRLLFKRRYGDRRMSYPLFGPEGAQEFKTLVLRAGFNDSWLHSDSRARWRATYIRDEWMRRSMSAMGYPSARGIFVHLYLNGLYWGLYNLCERPDAAFVAANQGGSPKDYDSRNGSKVLSGDDTAWRKLMSLADSGLENDQALEKVGQYVDLTEFTDYMILNFFAGNFDWDRDSNWYAARLRSTGGKFRFFVWDAECTLAEFDACTIDFDDDQSPPGLFHRLCENAEFRRLFSRRVRHLFFNGGPLCAEADASRFQALAQQVEKAMADEADRWGDYRHQIHPDKTGPYEIYTAAEHWRPEVERILTRYFPQRTAVVLRQFSERGLWQDPNPEERSGTGVLEHEDAL